MATFLDLLPLVTETWKSIRARINAWSNAGVDPSSENFQDTQTGGFFWDMTQGVVLELERFYDIVGTELPAAILPAYSFGRWLDEHAFTIGLERKPDTKAVGEVTFFGTNGTLIPTGTVVATAQVDPDAEPVEFVVSAQGAVIAAGSVTLAIEADEAGAEGNVATGQITQLLSPIDGITSVTNADATGGGEDAESDDSLRSRLLLDLAQARGGGNVGDYERWALAYPGVGFVTVQPLWNGPGTVRLIITGPTNDPVISAIITGLQDQLDPVPGEGRGLAPIGATVTVVTPAAVTVNVAATVSLTAGYSLDGTGGTIAVRDDLEASVREYIDRLPPGVNVVLNHVRAQFFLVPGIIDVTALTLNGSAANVVITLTPPQVAQTGSITLT